MQASQQSFEKCLQRPARRECAASPPPPRPLGVHTSAIFAAFATSTAYGCLNLSNFALHSAL
jgi:hypothetical protein